jgi:hypothetical protein
MTMTNAQLSENERLRNALREAEEQQAATSEILRIAPWAIPSATALTGSR